LNKYLYTDKNKIKVNININKSSEKIGKDKTEQKYLCTRQQKENFTFRAQTHSHSLSRPILYCRLAHNQEFYTALNFEALSLVFQNMYISILRALGKVQWFAES
jgi:hypothetical protein